MREADRLDPDVETDKHGNRVGGAAAGAGAGAGAGAAAGVGAGALNALEPNDGGASGGWGNVDDDDDEALEPGRHRDDADPARTDPPRTAAPDCAPSR